MKIFQKLKSKKTDLEDIFDLEKLKPTRFLKLIQEEIIVMNRGLNRVEQLEAINSIFNKKINYNTYIQFFNMYIKIKSNKPNTGTVDSNNIENNNEEGTEDEYTKLQKSLANNENIKAYQSCKKAKLNQQHQGSVN